MNINRRKFLGGALALGALGGCQTLFPGRKPDLRLGVISDVHIMDPESTVMLRRSLAYFRDRDVDVVVCAGDLTDWGLKSGFAYFKQAWDDVMAGSGIVPICCTGNHDFDGWGYGDMTMQMHALGYCEEERAARPDMKTSWEAIFGQSWAPIRKRTVKGYDFVTCEYGHEGEVADWLTAHGRELQGERPFFYIQHLPILTHLNSSGTNHGKPGSDSPVAAPLAKFPNCLALTGHVHVPFNNETDIRQEGFTELSIPSLSYASPPRAHENGGTRPRRPENSTQAMQLVPTRFNLRGGQGYVVSLYGNEAVIERRDLEEGVQGGEDWLLPLPLGSATPFAYAERARNSLPPEFPADAKLQITTRNSDLRNGQWCIVMKCDFPSATISDGTRVFDYEIRAVPRDGSQPMIKRFLSPAFASLPKYEPEIQHFWFNVAELPQNREYVIEVYARNSFCKYSQPLKSAPRRGKPGLGKAER